VPAFKRAQLPPSPLSDLMDALYQLHLVAGQPSLRDLQRGIGGRGAPSHAAIHNAFTGSKLPTWRLVEPLVQVMARRVGRDEKAEVDRFRTLWTGAAGSRSSATEPEATASERAEASKPIVETETERFAHYLAELMPGMLDEIEAIGTGEATGSFRIPTGFDDLDALLGGWSQGYLIVVGGRPSSGKTTLLLNFCRAASIKYKLPSIVISGEMNSSEIQSRLLSAEARVPSHTMRTGQMNDDDWRRLAVTMAAIANTPIQIGTPPDFGIERLSVEASRLVQESGLKLLLIDSLQWITGREVPDQAPAELILWRLKTLAEKLKVPIIITAHAGRPEGGILPVSPIAHLTYGDAIERVADVVIILDRPDQDEPDHLRAGEADLRVVKNRNGPTATVTVAFQGHYSRFLDMVSSDYPMFRAQPQAEVRPDTPAEVQATAHDREFYRRLLEQLPQDGEVIDWLKNNFVLKYFPVRHLDNVVQVAKAMSLEVVGFDDKETDDRYNDLRQAIENFHDQVLYYTLTDQSLQRLEVPAEWRDREDHTQYNTAMSTIKEVHKAFVEAYDSFLQTCHKKAIDRDASSDY
jgi:replicative DNA helicase